MYTLQGHELYSTSVIIVKLIRLMHSFNCFSAVSNGDPNFLLMTIVGNDLAIEEAATIHL